MVLNVPVTRSSVQLSFWTLCLCGSQESARPSLPGSWPWMLNALHASFTENKHLMINLTVHQSAENKGCSMIILLLIFFYLDLKGCAGPGWESFLLSVQLISLSCGWHADGSQCCKLIIHCMGKPTEVWVHSRAETKHTEPVWGKETIQTIYSTQEWREDNCRGF